MLRCRAFIMVTCTKFKVDPPNTRALQSGHDPFYRQIDSCTDNDDPQPPPPLNVGYSFEEWLQIFNVCMFSKCADMKCNPLQRRHSERDGVSNHRRIDCLLNSLLRSQKTSKLCVTGLCAGNPPVTGGFPSQMDTNAENVWIWWRHHDMGGFC